MNLAGTRSLPQPAGMTEGGGARSAQLLLPPSLLAPSDLVACLPVLLQALGWHGSADEVAAALPHAQPDIDLTDLRNVLARLGHPTRMVPLRAGPMTPVVLPALLLRPGCATAVLWRDEQGRLLIFDGQSGVTAMAEPGLRGMLMAPAPPQALDRRAWFATCLRRFVPMMAPLLGLSALIALTGLVGPLFTMAVFDGVIAGRTAAALPMLALGAAAAMLAEATFRMVRRRALSHIGARLDRLIACGVFTQLMSLPTALVERAGIAAQVSRLRDFAAIREFLTGALAIAVLDLPFCIIVFATMAVLGGWIAVVPLATAVLLGTLFFASNGGVQRRMGVAARAAQRREALAVEVLEARRTIRLAGVEARWAERYAAAAAEAASASARATAYGSAVQVAAQSLVTASGLVAMAMGAAAVIAGTMSAGALVSGMMLIWRVLAPLQSVFLILGRWDQTRASIRQVDSLMAMETERIPVNVRRLPPPALGRISFDRVSLRYLPQSEPVLNGVSLRVDPGEVVAIIGGEGSGKSSLLRLVAGLYRAQGGLLKIDGQDVRAYDPASLRQSIAWVPQTPELLYGTIAQNLRLARPTASDAALYEACISARVLTAIEAMPDGMETRVGDNCTAWLPRSILMRIALARALLRDAPILLLDESVAGMDDESAQAFAGVIERLRGRTTILMTTHRPSHMGLADRVLRVRGGQVEELQHPGVAPSKPKDRMPLLRFQDARG